MNAAPARMEDRQTLLRGRVPATAEAVSVVLDRLGRALSRAGVEEGARADALLALGEILNNIVEHATAGIALASVQVDVTLQGGCLSVETVDRGRPLPPALLSSASLPPLPDDPAAIDALPEGGFGWFIIHEIAQDMTYEREDGENRLSFHFAV